MGAATSPRTFLMSGKRTDLYIRSIHVMKIWQMLSNYEKKIWKKYFRAYLGSAGGSLLGKNAYFGFG